MSGSRLLVVLSAVLGTMNTGCGVLGWTLTGKAEVTSYTIPRTQEVEVDSVPRGATIIVEGGEAGTTPKSVQAVVTEIRHQRRQSIVPGLIGLGLDVIATGLASAACIDSNSGECLLVAAGGGLGVFVVGSYLIFGRSFTDEGTDMMPTILGITVRHPGYQEQTRRIRVPDLTEVNFQLVPLGGQAPASPPAAGTGAPPPNPAPDAPLRRKGESADP